MNINKLISTVKNKINDNIILEDLAIEDKTFLHRSHKSHQDGKYHLKLIVKSKQLKEMSKIESTKKIYKILEEELKIYIHSIQILVN